MRGAPGPPWACCAGLHLAAPGRGQRAPWVLGAFPLRSSCPFKSKSRERGAGAPRLDPYFQAGRSKRGRREGGPPGASACATRPRPGRPGGPAPLSRQPARRGRGAGRGRAGGGVRGRARGRGAGCGRAPRRPERASQPRSARRRCRPPPAARRRHRRRRPTSRIAAAAAARPGPRPPIWCSRPRRRPCRRRPRAPPPPSGARSAAAAGGGLRPRPERRCPRPACAASPAGSPPRGTCS